MLIAENNGYPIGSYIVAAFGYATMNRRKVFQKHTHNTYRLMNSSKIVSHRSLHTLGKALQNESI